jgi:CBS domain-containing protein
MRTSVIRQRVADFLKQHAPFDTLHEADLLDLAGSGKVKFHESEEYVFRQGDPKGHFIWTIQQGRVELLEESSTGEQLRDVLGEGDLLGLERFAGDGSCLYSARTASDVILYGVAAAQFESTVDRYPSVKRFLAARVSVSGNLGFNRTSWLEADAPPIAFLRARLQVLPADASANEVASLLAESRNGVVALVDEGGRPVGTIDLCRTRPCPPTVASGFKTRTAVWEMLQSRGDQLAITADGTRDGRLEAIVTSSEMALFCGRDPVRLIDAIRHAGSIVEIGPLLPLAMGLVRDGVAQPQDVDDCCRIGTEVVAALTDACIRLADGDVQAAGIDAARVPHCWVMFGASARGDLLTPEIPTIAAVYDDTDPNFHAEDSIYFAALAGETAARLHAFGLPGADFYWPEGARPSMPLSEWKRLYSETARNPVGHDLYARRAFFDCSPLSGDASILQQLREHIRLELHDYETVIPLLANDTLAHWPPLTFFRGLVLELDGAQRESFDISAAVVFPIANAARVFAIAKGRLMPANTLARLELATLDFPQGADILREAADAFRIGLYYQTLAGVRIEPGKLGKFDRMLLKTAFSSIQRFLEFTVSTFIPES